MTLNDLFLHTLQNKPFTYPVCALYNDFKIRPATLSLLLLVARNAHVAKFATMQPAMQKAGKMG